MYPDLPPSKLGPDRKVLLFLGVTAGLLLVVIIGEWIALSFATIDTPDWEFLANLVLFAAMGVGGPVVLFVAVSLGRQFRLFPQFMAILIVAELTAAGIFFISSDGSTQHTLDFFAERTRDNGPGDYQVWIAITFAMYLNIGLIVGLLFSLAESSSR